MFAKNMKFLFIAYLNYTAILVYQMKEIILLFRMYVKQPPKLYPSPLHTFQTTKNPGSKRLSVKLIWKRISICKLGLLQDFEEKYFKLLH